MTDNGQLTWINEKRKLGDLIPWEDNPRQITEEQAERLERSIRKFGYSQPIEIEPDDTMVDGHQRKPVMLLIKEFGANAEIDVRVASRQMSLEERKEYIALKHEGAQGEWDWDGMHNLYTGDELVDFGFGVDKLEMHGFEFDTGEPEQDARQTLAERFIVPPFSVLDTRQGYWQKRKRTWFNLGIKGEIGREGGLLGFSDTAAISKGGKPASDSHHDTSVFDPVVCEIAYKWFCPPDAKILDPFAGGSVRGIVAEYLGYEYTGIELRPEQVDANKVQAKALRLEPAWIVGNAINVKELVSDEYDFIFSCPPYYNLEIYSDLDGELSALATYKEFIREYRKIIDDCADMLKDDRFACFVVGDLRDKKGFYRNFVSDTITAFQDAGMTLYNEAILVTAIGSLPIRISKQFGGYRKLGKTHQNVLVFYKGDPKVIKQFGAVDVGMPGEWVDMIGGEPELVNN